jgi:release factor glutamine methyltransferase
MGHSQIYQVEEDTLLLLGAARKEVRPGELVLEIGTGTGYIAASLMDIAKVVATDINPHATVCARKRGVEVIRADLINGISGRFDLIIFNPPYLPTSDEERIDDWLECALDGGESGRKVIERFIRQASSVLAPGGRILLLISSLTGEEEVKYIWRESGFHVSEVQRTAIEGGEELIVLRCTRNR